MRTLLPLMLTACAAGAPFPTGQVGNPAAGCEAAGAEYVQATSGTFTPNQFLVDTLAIYTDLNSVTSCVRSDGAGAAWLFDEASTPYGVLRVEATAPGNQPNGANLLLDLYGATPPVSWTGSQFDGNLSVGSTAPFSIDMSGTFSDGSRTAVVDFLATAVP